MSNQGTTKTPMTPSDASRIHRHADKAGANQDFKGRAQRAASKNESGGDASKGKGGK